MNQSDIEMNDMDESDVDLHDGPTQITRYNVWSNDEALDMLVHGYCSLKSLLVNIPVVIIKWIILLSFNDAFCNDVCITDRTVCMSLNEIEIDDTNIKRKRNKRFSKHIFYGTLDTSHESGLIYEWIFQYKTSDIKEDYVGVGLAHPFHKISYVWNVNELSICVNYTNPENIYTRSLLYEYPQSDDDRFFVRHAVRRGNFKLKLFYHSESNTISFGINEKKFGIACWDYYKTEYRCILKTEAMGARKTSIKMGFNRIKL